VESAPLCSLGSRSNIKTELLDDRETGLFAESHLAPAIIRLVKLARNKQKKDFKLRGKNFLLFPRE
jgi:hypothetical protein